MVEIDEAFGVESVEEIALVGTQFISGEGQDIDFVVLVDKAMQARAPSDSGWLNTSGVSGSGTEDLFETYRKGDVNLIVTEDAEFITQFKQAAEISKYVNSFYKLDKSQRIKLHRIIMNGETAE